MRHDAAEGGGLVVDVLEDNAVVALGDRATLPCAAAGDDGEFLEVAFGGVVALGAAGEVEVGPLQVAISWRVLVRVCRLDAFFVPFCDILVSANSSVIATLIQKQTHIGVIMSDIC